MNWLRYIKGKVELLIESIFTHEPRRYAVFVVRVVCLSVSFTFCLVTGKFNFDAVFVFENRFHSGWFYFCLIKRSSAILFTANLQG